jgi:hypothetical protein
MRWVVFLALFVPVIAHANSAQTVATSQESCVSDHESVATSSESGDIFSGIQTLKSSKSDHCLVHASAILPFHEFLSPMPRGETILVAHFRGQVLPLVYVTERPPKTSF